MSAVQRVFWSAVATTSGRAWDDAVRAWTGTAIAAELGMSGTKAECRCLLFSSVVALTANGGRQRVLGAGRFEVRADGPSRLVWSPIADVTHFIGARENAG